MERERSPLLWRGARGEAFRRFCQRSRLDYIRGTQDDVPVPEVHVIKTIIYSSTPLHHRLPKEIRRTYLRIRFE
jgi:hypothetical protein